ncbi:RIO1 family [Leishmania donovani]|uniref:Serine/threonine-protein kinase RIO1 n=1 Tax=Leishmania donovani TaxID=5661 RepID=A0A504XQA0_LEIDO|nr:RIO1 family protein [Leishmania donovani]CAJ1990494.1 RIO1 family [Leishmania donovani]VDZ46349.1 RIO1_family_putative/Pfam:PF01163 [Leishmania donovani]
MRFAKDAELLQYMVPGSTLADIVSSEEDADDYDAYFDAPAAKAEGVSGVVPGEGSAGTGTNAQGAATSLSKFQPAQHKNADAKVLGRIHIDDYYDGHGSGGGASGGAQSNQRVLNELRDMTMSSRFAQNAASKNVDRSERATVENVLDPRTRLILYKLVNSGILSEINGCVSTGKEANVYYAVSGDGSPAALKVYKTSILSFKDRDQYVSGEFRFQRYCKSNPRKMVRTWAEKEARNLIRLQDGGVLAPAVKLLRQHVLIMEFLGEDGWPAPRLKEVTFPSAKALDKCYLDLCCTMRKMYARSHLIHGDLSEYNLLLYRGRVVVIDVSQSVEYDHPRSMSFLRRDIVNVNSFFRSRGLTGLFTLQDLFHFITADPAKSGWQRCQGPPNDEELMARLKEIRDDYGEGGAVPVDAEQAKVDEQVFLNITVPRSLNEICDRAGPNKEVAVFVEGMTAASAAAQTEDHSGADGEGDGDGDDEDSEADDADSPMKAKAAPQAVLANMTKEERKEHRKAVKEANREKRAEKKKNNANRKKKGRK